jgi:hypothetical protein
MSERWLWTQTADIGPSPRVGHGMAYEDARQRVVLFGGWSGMSGEAPFGDTWEWDGSAWTKMADMGPPGRQTSGMTYDVSRQCVVLFGGWGGVGALGDTWEWDGTEWTQIVAGTGPSERASPTMVFDRSRECLVLFSGNQGNPLAWLGDTWEWDDDAGWVKRQDMGPRDIWTPKMVSTGKHTILFGNSGVGQTTQEGGTGQTWGWDGRLWTQRQDMGPPARMSHDLAYDSQRDRVVLFGGRPFPSTATGGALLGDTWELN